MKKGGRGEGGGRVHWTPKGVGMGFLLPVKFEPTTRLAT